MNNPPWRRYVDEATTKNAIILYESDREILGDAGRDLSPGLVDVATMMLQNAKPISRVRNSFKIASTLLIPFMPTDEAGAKRWYTRQELFGNRIWIVPVHLKLANRWALFIFTGLDDCRATRRINVYFLGTVRDDKAEVQSVCRKLERFLGMVHAQETSKVAWSDIEFLRICRWDRRNTEPSADSGCRMLDDMRAVLCNFEGSEIAWLQPGFECLEGALTNPKFAKANAIRTKVLAFTTLKHKLHSASTLSTIHIDTQEKVSKKRAHELNAGSTTTSHALETLAYEPCKRKMVSTKPLPDSKEAKLKKREHLWDSDAPTSSIASRMQTHRPFYPTTKATVKPQLPVKSRNLFYSHDVPIVVHGQGAMGSSATSSMPKLNLIPMLHAAEVRQLFAKHASSTSSTSTPTHAQEPGECMKVTPEMANTVRTAVRESATSRN